MLGAIAGDIIGSVYEGNPIKTKEFPLFSPYCRFTDDTVLTVAIAKAILEGREYVDTVRELGRKYINAGYGAMFLKWLNSPDPTPYNSWGNGSAMRVSPIGFAFDTKDKVLLEAKKSSEITHNHPEAIKGAQAVAYCIYLCRKKIGKEEIRQEISRSFGYDLEFTVEEIRPSYHFDVSCKGTVPPAIICFLDSDSYEDAVRNAVSLGGDSDTLACITGAISEAYYGSVPEYIVRHVKKYIPEEFWEIVKRFYCKFNLSLGA